MPRVRRGTKTRARHKKVLKAAKGYRESRGNTYASAKNTVRRAMRFQYRDRRNKKRDFRRLWIVRISAAAKANGISYSRLIHGLKEAGLELDRKILAEIAVNDKEAFTRIVETVRQIPEGEPRP
ncbi:50S ribosomal protein L20 [bacterium]|nr:50S ribosomal protein L20 [bacterium]